MPANSLKTSLVQFINSDETVQASLYLSGGTLTLDGVALSTGQPSQPTTVLDPSVGPLGVLAAIEAANTAGGGRIILGAGDWIFDQSCGTNTRINNVWIEGEGPSTVIHHVGFNGNTFRLQPSNPVAVNRPLGTITAGDTSATFTTHSDAGTLLAGDFVTLEGTDPDGFLDFETHQLASDGNGTTGVITFTNPFNVTLTSPYTNTTILFRGGWNNALRNMKIVLDTPGSTTSRPILVSAMGGFVCENIVCEGWASAPDDGYPTIWLQDSAYMRTKNIVVRGSRNPGIGYMTMVGSTMEQITLLDCGKAGNYSAFRFNGLMECEISDMEMQGNYNGIYNSGSIPSRRNSFRGIKILGCTNIGFIVGVMRDTLFDQITMKNVSAYGIYDVGGNNRIIGGNFSNCDYPIYVQGVNQTRVIGTNIFRPGHDGITFDHSNQSVASGNLIRGGSVGSGLVSSNSDQCVLEGNAMSGRTGTGITVDSGCHDNVVIGNQLKGLTLSDTGTNTQKSANVT